MNSQDNRKFDNIKCTSIKSPILKTNEYFIEEFWKEMALNQIACLYDVWCRSKEGDELTLWAISTTPLTTTETSLLPTETAPPGMDVLTHKLSILKPSFALAALLANKALESAVQKSTLALINKILIRYYEFKMQ